MAKTQFTQKGQSISPKRVLGAVVALTLGFLLLVSVGNVAQKYFTLRTDIQNLTKEKEALQEKQRTLTATNQYIATPEGTEQALREKYNVVKPGEEMIIVTDQNADQTSPQQSRTARWWNAILQGLGIHSREKN